MTGEIVSLNEERGFGFIRIPGESLDVFFHAKELTGGLTWDGQLLHRTVEFDLQRQPDGRERAVNVRGE